MGIKINIQFKLILVTIALVSAALAVTYFQTAGIIKNNFLGFIEDKIKVSDNVNNNYLEKILTYKLQSVQAFGESADLQRALRESDNLRIPYYMTRDYKDYDLDSFQLYSTEGILMGEAGIPAEKETQESIQAIFTQKNQSGIFVLNGKLYLMAAKVLTDGKYAIVGKTLVDDRLADEIKKALSVDVLILREGSAVGSSEFFKKTDLSLLDQKSIQRSLAGESVTLNRPEIGQMFLYRPITDRQNKILGSMILVVSVEIMNSIERQSQDTIIKLMAIAGLITLLITLLFARNISSPIRKLTRWAGKIQAGDYLHKEKIKTWDEINDLAKVFGSMSQTIYDYNNKMEHLVAQRTEELNEANIGLLAANNKNRKDLLLAQKIQTSLVPTTFPPSARIGFSGFYRPMEELGGDLYDVFKISEEVFGILILDVCGHGVPAALITTMAKVSFKTNSERFLTPDQVVAQVNREIAGVLQGSGDYFTVFYGVIDLKEMTLNFTNGGHPKAYILRDGVELIPLDQNSIFVGVMADVPFANSLVALKTGDKILLYTDGLLEARNQKNEVYDMQRFEEALNKYRPLDRKQFVDHLVAEVVTFADGREFDDDLTVLYAELT